MKVDSVPFSVSWQTFHKDVQMLAMRAAFPVAEGSLLLCVGVVCMCGVVGVAGEAPCHSVVSSCFRGASEQCQGYKCHGYSTTEW